MAEINDIKVKIAADASGVKKGTSDATKHLQGFAGSAASAFSGISAKAVAVGNIIAKAISKAFQMIRVSRSNIFGAVILSKNAVFYAPFFLLSLYLSHPKSIFYFLQVFCLKKLNCKGL